MQIGGLIYLEANNSHIYLIDSLCLTTSSMVICCFEKEKNNFIYFSTQQGGIFYLNETNFKSGISGCLIDGVIVEFVIFYFLFDIL